MGHELFEFIVMNINEIISPKHSTLSHPRLSIKLIRCFLNFLILKHNAKTMIINLLFNWNEVRCSRFLKYGTSLLYLIILIFSFQNDLHSQYETCRKNGFIISNPIIDCSEIKGGGPPRDGIPSIDKPEFTIPENAKHVFKNDYVLGVYYNGIAKAYPVVIMDYHEIVNDKFGDTPVAVTYCPLCGSGMSFIRKVEDRGKTFGVSGLLYNSDVLLFDRQTNSLWSQIMGQAISGPEVGRKLEYIPTIFTTWTKWREMYPKTLVLTQNTGAMRDYFISPYEEYEFEPTLMFTPKHTSKAFKNKERIIGIIFNRS